jgi:dCMP deaminase
MHKTCIDLKDCTIYTTYFPCNECAKIVIQAGIKKIYYLMDDKPEKLYMKSSRELLRMAGYQFDGTGHTSQGRSEALASQKLIIL